MVTVCTRTVHCEIVNQLLSRFSKKVWELPQFPHCDGSLELVTFFAFSDTVTIKMWESIEWPNIAKNNTGSKELMKTLKQCMELTNHRNLFITFLDCSSFWQKRVYVFITKNIKSIVYQRHFCYDWYKKKCW